MYRILGIGELLWDMLPEGPQLGGAPANYTVMAGKLGDHAVILSRLGQDELGERARATLKPTPVDCSQLQTDLEQPTGKVTVELAEGQPSYTIHQPVAWDFFELTDGWLAEVAQADAVCYGSLAQRSDKSRETIHALVRATKPECHRIFDVNLRSPFYAPQILRESLKLASVVKMNDVEVPMVLGLLGIESPGPLREKARALLNEFPGLTLAAVTCGGNGSILVSHSDCSEHSGVHVEVADTIGAGDAFTAAMTHYLLRGAPLSVLNEAGNRWGSYVASQSGAMPEISAATLQQIEREIEG